MKPDCKKCKSMTKYVAVDNPDHFVLICSGDGWEEESDGTYSLTEISEFDESECLLFSKKVE